MMVWPQPAFTLKTLEVTDDASKFFVAGVSNKIRIYSLEKFAKIENIFINPKSTVSQIVLQDLQKTFIVLDDRNVLYYCSLNTHQIFWRHDLGLRGKFYPIN